MILKLNVCDLESFDVFKGNLISSSGPIITRYLMESETEERNININIYTFKSTRPHPSVPFAVFHHVPKQAKAED